MTPGLKEELWLWGILSLIGLVLANMPPVCSLPWEPLSFSFVGLSPLHLRRLLTLFLSVDLMISPASPDSNLLLLANRSFLVCVRLISLPSCVLSTFGRVEPALAL